MVRKLMRNWLYNVGDTIIDDKRNMTITNQIIKDGGTYIKNGKTYHNYYMYYNYDCNICGYSNGEISQSNLKKGTICSCCSNKIVVKGINDLATVRPDLLPYLIENKEYLYTENSGQSDYFKCPDCGKIKKMIISNLSNNGFHCSKCSDGISYPEKFIISVLDQLNIKYIQQLTKTIFEWCGRYRYDFYLPDYNCIIEVHGEQHYNKEFSINNRCKTLEEQKHIDMIKKELALQNGISKYFIINASKSNKEYIKKSILELTEIHEIIDCNKINWDICNIDATKNICKEVCEYWNKHQNLTSLELAKIFHLSKTAILTYLHTGTDIGWCDFSKEEQSKKNGLKQRGKKKTMTEKFKVASLSNIKKARQVRKDRAENRKICQYNKDTEELMKIGRAHV